MSEAGLTLEDKAIVKALGDAGWTIAKVPYTVDLDQPPAVPDAQWTKDAEKHAEWRNTHVAEAYRAVRYVAANKVEQGGENLEQLLERCVSWDADQARLKPEFRLGGSSVEVMRAGSEWPDEVSA